MAIPYAKKGDPATYLRVVKRAQKLIGELATTGLDSRGRADATRRIRKVIDDVYDCEPYLPEAREADALMASLRAAEEKSGELYQTELQGALRGTEERAREARIAARERGDYSYQEELKLSAYRPRQGNPVGPPKDPIATFRNDEDQMESYVVTSTRPSGGYNVTLRDLDSGEMIPWAQVGIQSLEDAIARAKEIVRFPLAKTVGTMTAEDAVAYANRPRQHNPVGGRAARQDANTYRLNGQGIDLDDFFRDNQEGLDPEDVAAIRAMRPGDKLLLGGGAAADFTITRGMQKRPWAAWPKPLVRSRFADEHDWHAFRALEEWALRYEQRPRPTHVLTVPLVVAVEPVNGRFQVSYRSKSAAPIASFGSYESAREAARLAVQAAERQANR